MARIQKSHVVFALGLLAVVVFVAMQLLVVVAEVGHRDLLISFVVKDANTGQPIPNASIHLRDQAHDFCDDREVDDLTLACDTSGHVSRLVEGCMWSSTHGYFVDSFGMHLPHWWYSASAPGYLQCDEAFLDDGEKNKNVTRGRPATLEAVVLLHRKAE